MRAFIFLSTILAAAVFAEKNPKVHIYDTLDLAIDGVTNLAAASPETTSFYVLVQNDLFGISKFKAENPSGTGSPDGKLAAISASWVQHKITKHEVTMGEWKPASCVFLNEYGAMPISIAITPSSSYRIVPVQDFNSELGAVAALYTGPGTAGADAKSGIWTFNLPAYTLGQVWLQTLLATQNQQFRQCFRKFRGGANIECGEWSKDVLGDVPVNNAVSYGWRTLYDKLDLDSCGGDAWTSKKT
ncbi:hypothetical protein METSCH_E02260 [Metschnikowia aff. pulcherrima]|uniref:Uncharacterized protein n=1 Tax=Metschnikowia aff. pulcherrima TaxID=2163413 RepID=A0A4P6XS88_9ASCO|nr:hypothetical protein METSCH_E02260 [Metschnikowia aff. pulcherrima]